MIFNKYLYSILLIICVSTANSQTFEWIRSAPVAYNLNPSYPDFAVDFNEASNRVVHSRIDSVTLIYGQTVFGITNIESRDTTGQLQWQLQLGDKAEIKRIETDPSGNIYVAGVFQETMYIGTIDSMEYVQGLFTSMNTFILKLDAQGSLLWKRNLNVTWTDYEGIEALAIDHNGNCWYAQTDFFAAHIVGMDSGGNDVTIHTIDNGKRIGNMSFDPWGGMFVSGAAESGNFIMDNDTFPVIHNYNMFIARFDPAGQPSWAYFGYDITFQKPMVVADNSGNAFMAGNRYDTTSFNGVFFTNPYLNSDFFAFMIDSSGNILWDLQQPLLGMAPYGTFEQGSNLMVAADASGKFYMGGTQIGSVDWGNGYISSTTGVSDRKIAVTCIDPAGSVQWVKLGGGTYTNYMHGLSVSDDGDCYFTGGFSDTAVFDTIVINTSIFYNFVLGKISPATSTGFDEVANEQLLLFPNPGHGIIYFPESMKTGTLNIYDHTGRLVYGLSDINQNLLDIRHLPGGIYNMVFDVKGKISHARIIKY